LIKHDDIVTMVSQFISDQRAGDASAHHRHIATQVGIKLLEGIHQAILDRPVRISAFQIHRLPPPKFLFYYILRQFYNISTL